MVIGAMLVFWVFKVPEWATEVTVNTLVPISKTEPELDVYVPLTVMPFDVAEQIPFILVIIKLLKGFPLLLID